MKRTIAVLAAAAVAIGGVSFVNASAEDPDYDRPAPTDPQPDKVIESYSADGANSRQSVDRLIEAEATQAAPAGFVFVPINPYRTYDSRAHTDGYLLAGEEVFFDVLTDEFGVQQIPSNAVAVTYNLTVTGTSGGAGYLALFPADIDWPGNSSINWTGNNTTLANGGTVAIGFLTAEGQVSILHGPGSRVGGTEVILDITGYYI